MLITYHSQSGASAQLAHAALTGARTEDRSAKLLVCAEAGSIEVQQASGLLLICAENGGRLAGGAKDFLDRIFYPLNELGCCKSYALIISAGNDGSGAVGEARRIFRGIPLSEALEPVIVRGIPDSAALQHARELGAGFAAGLTMGLF
ncbi:MAG: flavodoxin [Pseudomonadota bacterium]